MKTIQVNKLWTLLLALVVVTSCVKTDDFDMPNLNIVEPNINPDAIVEIASVAGQLAQSGESMYTFGDTDTYMVGYVISNDDGGNFFKQLILQDKPENPTVGIKVLLDESPLYITYEVGRRVYIKLDGLTVGESNGVLALGIRGDVRPERIPYPSIPKHVLRSAEVATIVPRPITIEQFSDANTNLMVTLTDMQFKSSELLKTFASEPGDQFDGERVLESCATGATAVLNTSTFARFKGVRVPSGRGNMDAILVKSFNGADFRLYVNDPSTFYFDSTERCDEEEEPIEDEVPIDLPFTENFESVQTGTGVLINLPGWRNVNVTGGQRRYEARSFDGNKYAQITAFGSNESTVEAWLVTPYLNLNGTTSPTLNFKTKDGFNNGACLKVFVSTDLENSTIGEATWIELTDVIIASGTQSGYADNFTDSGNVDLSDYIGQNIHIGFQYVGGSSGVTTTMQIDDISITD